MGRGGRQGGLETTGTLAQIPKRQASATARAGIPKMKGGDGLPDERRMERSARRRRAKRRWPRRGRRSLRAGSVVVAERLAEHVWT